jgi:hypothetical protein
VSVEDVRTSIKSLSGRYEIIDGVLWIKDFLNEQKNLPLNTFNNAHKKIISIINGRPDFIDATDCLPDDQGEYRRVSLSTKESVWIRDDGTCRYTNEKIKTLAGYELDHIHPRSKGGGDDYQNLACCTKQHNREKSDKIVDLKVPHFSASLAKKKLMNDPKLLKSFNSFFDRNLALIDGKLRDSNVSSGAKVSPIGRGSSSGKGNSPSNSKVKDYTPEFEEWWGLYKKGNKSTAFEAWKKQSPSDILEPTKVYIAYCKSIDRPMLDGQGFINQRTFETTWTHAAQGTSPLGNQDKPRAI